MSPPAAPAPPPSPAVAAFRRRLLAFGLFLATLLLFSRAASFGFLDFDDPDFVAANPHVAAGLAWDGLAWAFASGGNAGNWQPLTWLSYMLDAQLWGLDPRAFHAVNLGWHALNAAIAFLLWQRLTGATRLSAFVVALWAWHPLRVESVAWVSERKDVLSVFFALLTLWAYTDYARARGRRAVVSYVLALGAFALGLLCKAMLVALPGALFLLDLWPLQRIPAHARAAPRWLLEKLPFAVLSGLSCWITYRVQQLTGGLDPEFGLATRAGNAAVAIWRYLGQLAWPFELSACYPLHPWPAPTVAAAALALAGVSILLVRQWRSRPWLLFGWAWFLGLLVPVLGFVQSGPQAMADRYTYLPSLGLLVAAFWALRSWRPFASARGIGALAVVVLVACAARTWTQIGFWRDSPTLFTRALALSPDNYLAHTGLTTSLLNDGRVKEAAAHARAALALDPRYAPAHARLGFADERLGLLDDAIASYRNALQLRPDLAFADFRLGVLLLRRGETGTAVAHFAAAVRRQPDYAEAWRGLGRAQARRANWSAADAAYTQALQLQPDDATLHNEFANLLADRHRLAGAAAHYTRALLLDPALGEAHFNYANLLRESGQPAAACAHYRRAAVLLPHDADVPFGLGVALEQRGDPAAAEQAYGAALALDPTHPEAHFNLGALLASSGQLAEARAHFALAVRHRPDFTAAYLAIALLAEQAGDWPAALAAARHAATLAPREPEPHYRLGNALAATGDAAGAVREWQAARALHGDFPDLAAKLAAGTN